ncbi:hypothetical protein AB0F71_07210 [Kitasatospora sp. NPDC028055]|uniref:hypothetical protein n=1 Tax=Kitasatospora sp. NPDC028055 TaxID=3155653 RepID=UPI003402919B
MTATHEPSDRRPLPARLVADGLVPVRLAQAGAWLWGIAPLYLLVTRPRHANRLPPREQWGAAEVETSQLNTLAAGFIAFLVLSIAAAAVFLWIGTAVHLRRGTRTAPALAIVTALGTASVAVVGVDQVCHGLLNGRSVGVLVPLLSVSVAALAVGFRAARPGHQVPVAGR